MNLTSTDISETRKELVVTLSGDEIAAEEQRILKDFNKHARIPGFRPGKAPEQQIRTRYAKQIAEELKTVVTRKVFEFVRKDKSLNLYAVVEFPDIADLVSGREANVDLTIDVQPQFELPEYKGLMTRLPSLDVADAEIDSTIDRIRAQHADFVVVERAAQAGDYVKLSYIGKIGDDVLADQLEEYTAVRSWGSVTDGWEEAGTEDAKEYGVPALIDALVGMAAGDSKTVEQVIPESFPVEALRGKSVTYELSVGEVRERMLPDLDEEFFKSVRAESLADLKAQILDQLEGRKRQDRSNLQREQILSQLAAAVDFPLPESAVEAETQNAMTRIVQQNAQQGVTDEIFEQHKEQIFQSATQTALRDVKLQLILARIADAEAVKIDNEDLSRAVYSLAMSQRRKPEEVAKELRKDQRSLHNLQRQILFSKTLDKVISYAKVEEAEPLAAGSSADGEISKS